MPGLDNVYDQRYWEGEPGTSEGLTHIVGTDRIDGEKISACGRLVVQEGDFWAPPEQLVTCLRCWYRGLRYPKLITWS